MNSNSNEKTNSFMVSMASEMMSDDKYFTPYFLLVKEFTL